MESLSPHKRALLEAKYAGAAGLPLSQHAADAKRLQAGIELEQHYAAAARADAQAIQDALVGVRGGARRKPLKRAMQDAWAAVRWHESRADKLRRVVE